MSGKSIFPIIFYPIKKDGIENYESIINNFEQFSSSQHERFVREIKFTEDNKLLSTIGSEEVIFELPTDGHKRDSYAVVHEHRIAYTAAFERLLNDIYTLENKNYALENNINLSKPQIIVLASISFPLL